MAQQLGTLAALPEVLVQFTAPTRQSCLTPVLEDLIPPDRRTCEHEKKK